MSMRTVLSSLLLAVCGAVPCVAQTQARFAPTEPAADAFDWVKLKSGEWLKGEVLSIRKGTLEFDSDELDELKLDMDDVALLRSPRQHTVQFENLGDLFGTLLITPDSVTVTGAIGGTVDRALLMSVVPGDGSWRSHWSGKASLGYTARSGNSSQSDFTSYLFFRRQTSATRWDTSFNSAVSQVGGTETANNARMSSNFDVFLTRRLFVTPLALTALKDTFSNIDIRITPAAAIGYDLFDQNAFRWQVAGGPAYEYTRYESVAMGESITKDSLALALGTGVEWDITPDVELKFDYAITVPFPESDEYSHHLATVMSLDFVDWIDVDITAIWDRINQPLADEGGLVPEPDDFRLTVGFGIDF